MEQELISPEKELKCSCGNVIPINFPRNRIKCYDCNHLWKLVNNKWQQIPKPVVNCPCSNEITVPYEEKQVKCFRCNRYLDKNLDGVWERQPFIVNKDAVTIGDLRIRKR